jgi:hypothetical protein
LEILEGGKMKLTHTVGTEEFVYEGTIEEIRQILDFLNDQQTVSDGQSIVNPVAIVGKWYLITDELLSNNTPNFDGRKRLCVGRDTGLDMPLFAVDRESPIRFVWKYWREV